MWWLNFLPASLSLSEPPLPQPAPAAQQPLLCVNGRRPHHRIRATGRRRLLHLPGADGGRQHPGQGPTGGHRWWGWRDCSRCTFYFTLFQAVSTCPISLFKLQCLNSLPIWLASRVLLETQISSVFTLFLLTKSVPLCSKCLCAPRFFYCCTFFVLLAGTLFRHKFCQKQKRKGFLSL